VADGLAGFAFARTIGGQVRKAGELVLAVWLAGVADVAHPDDVV
jgi:hypothetical protein